MTESPTVEPQSPDNGGDFASLFVSSIRTENFRGIVECQIDLERDLTVLVGLNNVGKSRIMRALALALGHVAANKDDLTVGTQEDAVIDVYLSPASATATGDEIFDDRVIARLRAPQTISEAPERQRFAWRTRISPSGEGYGARADHYQLTYDHGQESWSESNLPSTAFLEQRSVAAADLVNTGRDLASEITRRGSSIQRILDDLEVDEDARTQLEEALGSLSDRVVHASGSLGAVQAALEALSKSIDGLGAPSLRPLPLRIEELSRSVSVNLDAGTGSLPMRFHGAGARSLASLQVQGVLYDRRLGRDGMALRPHPVSLIEEPEANLHPQAQFELPSLLERIRGQVVVSTHSAHLVSVVEPRSLRILRRSDAGICVVDLRPTDDSSDDRARRPSMHLEEMERLRRMVERPFGEVVFASAVVLGDGATERALIPPLARHSLGTRANGLCVVDPGSMASPYAAAVVKFAELVGLPWLLFADADDQGSKAAKRLDNDYGDGDEGRIVWVPGPPNIDRDEATEQMLIDHDHQMCAAACRHLGYEDGADLLQFMKKHKGAAGRLLSAELVERYPWHTSADEWPEPLKQLVARLDQMLPPGGRNDG